MYWIALLLIVLFCYTLVLVIGFVIWFNVFNCGCDMVLFVICCVCCVCVVILARVVVVYLWDICFACSD